MGLWDDITLIMQWRKITVSIRFQFHLMGWTLLCLKVLLLLIWLLLVKHGIVLIHECVTRGLTIFTPSVISHWLLTILNVVISDSAQRFTFPSFVNLLICMNMLILPCRRVLISNFGNYNLGIFSGRSVAIEGIICVLYWLQFFTLIRIFTGLKKLNERVISHVLFCVTEALSLLSDVVILVSNVLFV